MKKSLMICALILGYKLMAFEKLPDPYLVQYGNPQAPLNIVQYFSFTCPHCIALFRKQFQHIKEDYIETEKISWVFHPVPMDLLTLQGMDCLSKLSEREKDLSRSYFRRTFYRSTQTLSATDGESDGASWKAYQRSPTENVPLRDIGFSRCVSVSQTGSNR